MKYRRNVKFEKEINVSKDWGKYDSSKGNKSFTYDGSLHWSYTENMKWFIYEDIGSALKFGNFKKLYRK